MSNKKIVSIVSIIIFSIGIVALSGYFIFFQSLNLSRKAENSLLTQENVQDKVSYIISTDQSNQNYEVVLNSTSSTIFSALQKIAQERNFPIIYKIYPEMGVLVETIGDKTNGQENKYWQYWVNGMLGEVACDKKILKSGDVIEWKFDKVPAF